MGFDLAVMDVVVGMYIYACVCVCITVYKYSALKIDAFTVDKCAIHQVTIFRVPQQSCAISRHPDSIKKNGV